jgi:hypothetical protein
MSLQLPKVLDVGFAVLTITPKSVSVDVETSGTDAADAEQEALEVSESVVGELCNEEATRAEWFVGPLREYQAKKKSLPDDKLAEMMQSHKVYLRKGMQTFRAYKVEPMADVTPSRRAKTVEKYSQAVAFEFVSDVFERVLGESIHSGDKTPSPAKKE